jgi:predicted DNA-binding transcriptional regulator AlpA
VTEVERSCLRSRFYRDLEPARRWPEGREQVYAALRNLAAEMSAGDLPEFLAEIERAKWSALLRIEAVRPPAAGRREPLLTAEQVAGRLQVSEAQVYRLAKTALRPAAVEIGPGTLRFDPDRLARFIEARRRGS